MKSKILNVCLSAALCCVSFSLSAQALLNAPPPLPTDTQQELLRISDLNALMQRADRYKADKDMRRYSYVMERLLQLRPYSPTFSYRLAEAYAILDQKTKAYDLLIKIQKQGLALNPDPDKDFDPIRETPAFKYIIEGLKNNATPWGEGKVAITLSNSPELLESVAYDSKRQRFFVGSVRTGEIVSVSKDGSKTSIFAAPANSPGLKSVFAMAADDKRGFLWVGTAGAPQFERHKAADIGYAAILKFDMATGKVLEAYPLPVDGIPKNFGSIAVAGNGVVYATDAITNVVYQIRDLKLRKLFDVPGSTSLRGIAVSPDEKFLYFVDYELGLRVADLAKSEVRDLFKEEQNLGGIEGIYFYQDHLIAIQNGSIPTRVIRIKLDTDRKSIKGVQPIEANKDLMEMPTYGTMVGDDVYFIANSQRDLYGADGKPLEGNFPQARVLYQVSARFAWEADPKGGEMRAVPKGGK